MAGNFNPPDLLSPDFVSLNETLRCPLCEHVLREAVQNECGHRTCKNCMEKYIADNGIDGAAPCPADNDCGVVSQSLEDEEK